MIEDDSPTPDTLAAANDNAAAGARIDRAALILARLLGRQMARDAFERLKAANDNRPPDSGGT
ncbi:hypothetical protein [Azospirillum sp. TSO22-1]|uniref:hypothetical protein n=1 Tax=Azospirillum sp. TSO22-1 TaxID=716789 RepID=UPI000D603575|nr:hypothetical protein [Azospirillum sp. TSO22-1]PWC31826.1 hypothetical protein TSO221_32665 [Azospirillum sp. TSO22-1]